ncbi:MAG: DegV family protein, partial [Coriobacteriia bacterium]|nr:DegV family protein [Coriobacteriia bacterium]
ASSISHTMARDLDLTVLPLNYFVDEVEHAGFFPDKPIDLKAFYNSMREGRSVRTSLPNPHHTHQTLEGLLQKGKDVLYLGFSSALSGTFDSVHNIANQLAEQYPERRIECVETHAASFAQGLIVKQAALMAKAGSTLDAVAQWVADNCQRFNHWVTVDDLSFVLNGGRMQRTGAFAANLLGIKPLLRIDEQGAIDVVEKCRGRKAVLKKMAQRVKDRIEGDDEEIVIGHGDCLADAEKLRDLIMDGTKLHNFAIHYLDPVIGTHGGPGSMAVFFRGGAR